jgi:hypothetical protein
MRKRFHPDGVAGLIAVITAPEGLSDQEYNLYVDRTREQILSMAGQYYKVNECDYEDAEKGRLRDRNNLAKLNRANIR